MTRETAGWWWWLSAHLPPLDNPGGTVHNTQVSARKDGPARPNPPIASSGGAEHEGPRRGLASAFTALFNTPVFNTRTHTHTLPPSILPPADMPTRTSLSLPEDVKKR